MASSPVGLRTFMMWDVCSYCGALCPVPKMTKGWFEWTCPRCEYENIRGAHDADFDQ